MIIRSYTAWQFTFSLVIIIVCKGMPEGMLGSNTYQGKYTKLTVENSNITHILLRSESYFSINN